MNESVGGSAVSTDGNRNKSVCRPANHTALLALHSRYKEVKGLPAFVPFPPTQQQVSNFPLSQDGEPRREETAESVT